MYYKILDKGLIGRQDGMFKCYIYDSERGWIPDVDNILMDRLIGYDGDEIGNTDMLTRVKEITEKEALAAVKNS